MIGGSNTRLPMPSPKRAQPISNAGVPEVSARSATPLARIAKLPAAANRRSARPSKPPGRRHPGTAQRAAALTAVAAPVPPKTRARRSTRRVTSPICAKNPSAKPADKVANRRSRKSARRGLAWRCGCRFRTLCEDASPSGATPFVSGVGPRKCSASGQIVAVIPLPPAPLQRRTPSYRSAAPKAG